MARTLALRQAPVLPAKGPLEPPEAAHRARPAPQGRSAPDALSQPRQRGPPALSGGRPGPQQALARPVISARRPPLLFARPPLALLSRLCPRVAAERQAQARAPSRPRPRRKRGTAPAERWKRWASQRLPPRPHVRQRLQPASLEEPGDGRRDPDSQVRELGGHRTPTTPGPRTPRPAIGASLGHSHRPLAFEGIWQVALVLPGTGSRPKPTLARCGRQPTSTLNTHRKSAPDRPLRPIEVHGGPSTPKQTVQAH